MARPTNTTGKKKNNVRPASTRPTGFYWVLGIIALVGASILGYTMMRKPADVVATDAVTPVTPIGKAEGYLIGKPDAPVKIIEFADFECPGCGQFATLTEPDVRARFVNTGQIRIRYLDYPLPMHKNTWDASLAAACANDQGKFWEMHDALYANQDRWNGEATSRPRGPIGELAKSVGLDMQKYGACMDADTHRAGRVERRPARGARPRHPQVPHGDRRPLPDLPGLRRVDRAHRGPRGAPRGGRRR